MHRAAWVVEALSRVCTRRECLREGMPEGSFDGIITVHCQPPDECIPVGGLLRPSLLTRKRDDVLQHRDSRIAGQGDLSADLLAVAVLHRRIRTVRSLSVLLSAALTMAADTPFMPCPPEGGCYLQSIQHGCNSPDRPRCESSVR